MSLLRKQTKEHIEKRVKALRENGTYVFSKERREKLRLAKLGKKQSPEFVAYRTRNQKGRVVSEETKKRMSLSSKGKPRYSQRGEKSAHWKGGLTEINRAIRGSLEYRLWRTAVFERDKYTCVFCGARNGRGKNIPFNADHIKPFSLYPELRFAIDNGRTLCKPCHKTTDTYGGKIRRLVYNVDIS